MKKEVEEMLVRFYFVMWDRYTYNAETNDYSFYGWIDREKDNYKDFLEICFSPDCQRQYPDEVWDFTTSSAEFHNEICRILGMNDMEVNTCIRIEKDFDIPNVIHLHEEKGKKD